MTGVVLMADQVAKNRVIATRSAHQTSSLAGDAVRITYLHNEGALFGIHLGEHSRALLLALKGATLAILGVLYQATAARKRGRLIAIALVSGGALGNALDRLRHPEGVVDFLSVGLGAHRLPTFNLADVAVVGGAMLLVGSLLREYADRS